MADYAPLDRLLHRVALQVTPVAELSFDIDQRLNRLSPADIRAERHVFVSGLARAGTTILMRRIFSSGSFCSLTYRNMPFVLAPNVWSRFSSVWKQEQSPAERAHGDRILVDADSPESLDEVFWRVFDAKSYITRSFLTPHEPDEEIVEKYARYVSAILCSDPGGRRRYLSKNNNNILRLHTIRRLFPKSVILIPFRDPLSHAGSLLRQHKNFVSQQRESSFVRAYMTWLAHHEFGLDHRPFHFGDEGRHDLSAADPDGIGYWLANWLNVYAWLDRTVPEGTIFVCYEDLCNDATVWSRLAAISGADRGEQVGEPFVASDLGRDVAASPDLVEEAAALYSRLRTRANTALGRGARGD